MRIHLFIILFLSFYFQAQAQEKSSKSDKDSQGIEEPAEEKQVFSYVSEMPTFQGGGDAIFAKYIQDHIIYPKDAAAKGIVGTAYIQYTIEEDGSISNVKIIPGKGIDPSLDQAAITAIQNSPKWEPGKNNGVPVAVRKVARITFSL